MNKQPGRSLAQKLAIVLPYAWLIVFFLVPFLIVIKISLSQAALARPPYVPAFDLSAGWHGVTTFLAALSLESYARIGSDPLYLLSYAKSVEIAAFSTFLLLVIGYPIAYGIARTPRRWQAVLVLLVVLPFFTAFLIRIYAWMDILQGDGPLNRLLMALHIVSAPPVWLATDTAIYIGIVYSYLPFMVLPLYATLEKLDESLLEAAADLGCPRWRAFWLVTLPLSAPGVWRAHCCASSRRSASSSFPTCSAARDADDRADAVDRVLRQQGLADRGGDRGRAGGPVGVPIVSFNIRRCGGQTDHVPESGPVSPKIMLEPRLKTHAPPLRLQFAVSVLLGLALLYLPIVILVIYSFNASELVAVWGGWSTRWYAALDDDAPLVDAASISLRLAAVSASAATLLGTLAAVALARIGRFRGRLLFAAMIYAALVIPEVIAGLSMLLLFVALSVDRGFWTVAIAHTTMAMCFVTVIIQARLTDFDTALEEAAIEYRGDAAAHLRCGDLAAHCAGHRRRLAARLRALARRSRHRELHHRTGRDHAADPHLFGGAARREAGDECGMQHHGRRGRHRRHRRLVAGQVQCAQQIRQRDLLRRGGRRRRRGGRLGRDRRLSGGGRRCRQKLVDHRAHRVARGVPP